MPARGSFLFFGELSMAEAIEAGLLNPIKQHLEDGMDPNIKDPINGETPLIKVCRSRAKNAEKMARILLAAGADMTLKDNSGYNALQTAALRGNARLVALLLDEGVEIDEKDSQGNTALHLAYQFSHLDPKKYQKTINVLEVKGANRIIQNAEGLCPEQMAKAEAPSP